MFKFNPFKSLTVWGTVGALAGFLVQHLDPAALSPTATVLLQAGGALTAVLGHRNAVAKNGNGQ